MAPQTEQEEEEEELGQGQEFHNEQQNPVQIVLVAYTVTFMAVNYKSLTQFHHCRCIDKIATNYTHFSGRKSVPHACPKDDIRRGLW